MAHGLLLSLLAVASFASSARHVPEYKPPQAVIHQNKFAGVDEKYGSIRMIGFDVDPCEDTKAPDPIDTPDPPPILKAPVVVDYLIGIDGKPHSALILMSSGDAKVDSQVLRLVNSWRFHPLTCNGVRSISEALTVFAP